MEFIREKAVAGWNKIGLQDNGIFYVALAIHLFDIGLGFRRSAGVLTLFAAAYIFLAYYAWYKEQGGINWSQESIFSLAKFMGISMLCIALPWIRWKVSFLTDLMSLIGINANFITLWFDKIMIFFPFWVIFSIRYLPDDSFAKKAGSIYILALVILVTLAVISNMDILKLNPHQDIDVRTPIINTIRFVGKTLGDVYNSAVSGFSSGWKLWWQTWERATDPSYYNGQVDQNAEERLGVYITDIKTSQEEFFTDEPVAVWATVEAKSFGKEDITINTNCYAKIKDDIKEAKTNPETFKIYDYTVQDIDCSFDRNIFPEGSHSVVIEAVFNFQTLSYLKTYFIDKTRALALKRENIDILHNYGITDKNPVAVYTNGPVSIGLGLGSPLKMVDESDTSLMYLGVTISNQWEGVIRKLNSITIIVPSSIEMEGSECSHYKFEKIDCSSLNKDDENWCDDERYNVYRSAEGSSLNEKQISNFKTFRCPFRIVNPQELLGDTPITIDYFKVKADYEYNLSKSTTIRVVESPDSKKTKQSGETKKNMFYYTQGEKCFVDSPPDCEIRCDLAKKIKSRKAEGDNIIVILDDNRKISCNTQTGDLRLV